MNVSLSDRARWKLEEFLDALVVQEQQQITGDIFVGQFLRVDLIHEEYKVKDKNTGKEVTRNRANVSTYLPDEGGVANPAPTPAPVVTQPEAIVQEIAPATSAPATPQAVTPAAEPAPAKRPF